MQGAGAEQSVRDYFVSRSQEYQEVGLHPAVTTTHKTVEAEGGDADRGGDE
jgi:hypothetical protein